MGPDGEFGYAHCVEDASGSRSRGPQLGVCYTRRMASILQRRFHGAMKSTFVQAADDSLVKNEWCHLPLTNAPGNTGTMEKGQR